MSSCHLYTVLQCSNKVCQALTTGHWLSQALTTGHWFSQALTTGHWFSQALTMGHWFSQAPQVSSTYKLTCHFTTEILYEVTLNGH